MWIYEQKNIYIFLYLKVTNKMKLFLEFYSKNRGNQNNIIFGRTKRPEKSVKNFFRV